MNSVWALSWKKVPMGPLLTGCIAGTNVWTRRMIQDTRIFVNPTWGNILRDEHGKEFPQVGLIKILVPC